MKTIPRYLTILYHDHNNNVMHIHAIKRLSTNITFTSNDTPWKKSLTFFYHNLTRPFYRLWSRPRLDWKCSRRINAIDVASLDLSTSTTNVQRFAFKSDQNVEESKLNSVPKNTCRNTKKKQKEATSEVLNSATNGEPLSVVKKNKLSNGKNDDSCTSVSVVSSTQVAVNNSFNSSVQPTSSSAMVSNITFNSCSSVTINYYVK